MNNNKIMSMGGVNINKRPITESNDISTSYNIFVL
jgi:hypothetical protein